MYIQEIGMCVSSVLVFLIGSRQHSEISYGIINWKTIRQSRDNKCMNINEIRVCIMQLT